MRYLISTEVRSLDNQVIGDAIANFEVMAVDNASEAIMIANTIRRYGQTGLDSMLAALRNRPLYTESDLGPHPATEPAAAPSAFDSHYL